MIANRLFKMGNDASCLERNKKMIYDLVTKFRTLSKNIYPIDDYLSLPSLKEKKKKKKTKKFQKKQQKPIIENSQ